MTAKNQKEFCRKQWKIEYLNTRVDKMIKKLNVTPKVFVTVVQVIEWELSSEWILNSILDILTVN